ncbi:hypothetical protein [Bacillus thuringiensis]|uniref:hypothetical protein n=1 Tax=Bacillus thuringiensis TaxID=1428 RepID=UPI000BEBA4D1|nr:hypothetical protein [Bacillus thuringiensis]PDZ88914.1 hypothetical protein CON47_25735 [Bacillus thuringiensis]
MNTTVQVTKEDIVMHEIDTLVSHYQDALARVTDSECVVDTFQLGIIYVVTLRAGRIFKTLNFNLQELTEETN